MSEGNLQNQWNSGQQLSTGEGEVPLATPQSQNVDVRTLASDTASIQSSGGSQPRPYTPPPQAPSAPRPEPIRPPQPPVSSFQPRTPVGNPPVPPPPVRTPGGQATGPAQPIVPAMPLKKKSPLVPIIIVVLVLSLAAVGYFLVYPLFSQPANINTPETVALPPSGPTQPPVLPEPIPPVQPTSTSTSVPLIVPALTSHISLFINPADLTEEAKLASMTLPAFRELFTFDTAEVPILREIVLRDTQSNLLSFGDIMSIFNPNEPTDTIKGKFNPDATFFMYTDSKGTWMGIVAQLIPSLGPMSVQPIVSTFMENMASPTNYFLADPGTVGVWKGGQTSGVANRYLSFSKPGYALNYGWVGDKLVISASYDGFKDALKRLQ